MQSHKLKDNAMSPRILKSAYRLVRHASRSLVRAAGYGLPERSLNAYATHLPLLVGLARLYRVRRVLEFGCGTYSTLTFLNRAAFPDLVTLDSYENDQVWAATIAEQTQGDPLLHLHTLNGPMHTAVSSLCFEDYDLVFIDDSLLAEARAKTIALTAQYCKATNLVLVHDYEVSDYQCAAQAFQWRFLFNAYNPCVGLLSCGPLIDRRELDRLNNLVKLHAKHVAPEDVQFWLTLFDHYFITGLRP